VNKDEALFKGPISWMARNSVAANLLMIVLIVGGAMIAVFTAKQEVFPEFELDLVSISVPYPGASPEEVEKGILLAIEEQVRALDGVKEITAVATEGSASVSVELTTGVNANKALQDIKNGVDRITSFPQDAERPIVSLVTNRREVISMVIYGDLDERTLRGLGEKVREDLLALDGITTVDLQGVRPMEISIEVPQANLRAHNLTLGEISQRVSQTAIELPAGAVKTAGGEILLRTAERRDFGKEFADIPVVARPDGTNVLLNEIATITDGFRDTDQAAYFNGQPAVKVNISRVGDQKPIAIAETVKAYVEDLREQLPDEVGVATWVDASEIYRDRVNLLMRNAGLGLILVLCILGLFLNLRLAFWVMLGIPISVLGSFLLFPSFDVSINMISLFAFLITLGIVVDDAVVVGENVYEMRQRGYSAIEAAIRGAKQIALPVTFSILTNIAAFMPMMFVPGASGKFFRVIPIIVISVFLISLLESLFILPAHLAHQRKRTAREKERGLQVWFSGVLKWVIQRTYRPSLLTALKLRYLTMATAIAMLLITFGLVAGGRIKFTFLPKVDADEVIANAALTFGSPVADTRAVSQRLVETAMAVIEEVGGQDISRGVLTNLGQFPPGGGPNPGPGAVGGHLTSVSVFLVPANQRDFTASQFAAKWRDKLTDITGLESLNMRYSTGPSGGASIDIELQHSDIAVLETAAAELAEELKQYAGVKDIDDGFSQGKPQFDLAVKPEARVHGVTAAEMGRQLRDAFYGSRAFRQQRGREEIWIMIRLPENERQSEADIDNFLVRTPGGGEIPLAEAAVIERNRAYTEIRRRNGRRVVDVTADVENQIANANEVLAEVEAKILPDLLERHPGLAYGFSGERESQRESLSALAFGYIFAMMAIFALLAIPFRSYIQPLVVMTSIPFGMIGAILGHIVMGYDLSLISLMGIIALSGVVVNDSLVMIHTANENRKAGTSAMEGILTAGLRRFRPILLTSLTTFFGLAPMILETSVQARFLIPMAISLGFGILFSTFIILLLTPALYMIVEDIRRLFGFKELDEDPLADADPQTQPAGA